MFEECLAAFKNELENDDKLILGSYIPAEGSYIIVKNDGQIKYSDIKIDKKNKDKNPLICTDAAILKDIRFYDYHSKLISMNKPIDSKKIVHTNNYLAFAVKKESITTKKLTEAIIDNYYDTLKNPLEKKYKKSKEASKIYQNFEEEYGGIDEAILEKNRTWIKEHIFKIDSLVNIDLKKKEYLKIFFEPFSADISNKANEDLYIKEDNRYIYPNIYNSNEYNQEVDGVIKGIPDNNIGMNAKKPFLSIKTRKIPASYLIDGQEAILQKQFFEYLMNFAAQGKNNVYVDTINNTISAYTDKAERDNFPGIEAGYYLRIQKGKELEIQVQDNISNYRNELKIAFEYQDFLAVKDIQHENIEEYKKAYKIYTKRSEIGNLINEVFFSKYLITNYFLEPSDMNIKDSLLKQNIILYRNAIFDWVYKGTSDNFEIVIDKLSLETIKNAVFNNYNFKAMMQLNLRWSFNEFFYKVKGAQGGINMGDIITEIRESIEKKVTSREPIDVNINDREYYYAVGQLMSYFIRLSKASKKYQSMINPIINTKNDKVLKERLRQLYKKYNYAIEDINYNFNNLYLMILGYQPDGKTDEEMILTGYLDNNKIYTKREK